MSMAAHTVTARKAFPCNDVSCKRTVQPGEDYARFVAFPFDDEVNQSPRFWVLKVCAPCATQYDRPMPPRRTQKHASDQAGAA